MIWPICLILRVSTSMTAINCDQFAKILDDKLSPLNSRIAELKKSVDEAMNHVEFVNGEYDQLLQMMKTSNDERKALKDEIKILQDENKILKATIDSIERSLESVTRANHDLGQPSPRVENLKAVRKLNEREKDLIDGKTVRQRSVRQETTVFKVGPTLP